MNREFLDLYNRTLGFLFFLRDHARVFAEEYPGIAERLGGLLEGQGAPYDCWFVGARRFPGRSRPT